MVTSTSFHPFAMMVDPGAVLRAIESSSTLGRLQARVFRPLERQESTGFADDDLAAFDAEVDALAGEDDRQDTEDQGSCGISLSVGGF